MPGDSFTKALFHGRVAEDVVFPFPEPATDDRDATRTVVTKVRKFFANEVDSAAIDREAVISEKVLDGLKKLGLFGLNIPPAYGGLGLSMQGFGRVMEEVGGLDASIAVTLGAHESLGVQSILAFGSDAQKRKFLPRLATGESIAAFALTEAGTGSDAAATQTRAVRDPNGKGWILDGHKLWVTNGSLANVFVVVARTSTVDDGKKPRLTAFLVERAQGPKIGPPEAKLGIRGASTTSLVLQGVRVPDENVLGEVGRGFKVAMDVLNVGRLGLAAGTVGACKQFLRLVTARVTTRKAFGRVIGEFALIKDKIATMMAETWALESLTYLTMGLVDARIADFALESAVCKIAGSETLWRVANEAVQIAGGTGYMAAFPYERLLRDARIPMIFEGANEILRGYVAVAGLHSQGQELSDLARALRDPIRGIGLISGFAKKRAQAAWGRPRLSRAHPRLARESAIFEAHAEAFAVVVERSLRRHGRNIGEMQNTQRRLFEVALDLLLIVACLSRATRSIERRGDEGSRRELDLTSVFVSAADSRIRAQLAALDENDDELRKRVASRTYTDGGYPFDAI
jgi:acyl-CoA dehydrogenase family protein 9